MHTPLDARPRPQPVGLIRVAWLTPVLAFLTRAGAPVNRLLASAGLSASVFDDPEDLISLSQMFRFMEESARATGIANLGFLAGQETSIDALGVFGVLVRRARTVGEAIETAIHALAAFSSGGHCLLVEDGERARLSHEFTDCLDTNHAQADEYWLMLALNLLRLGAGPRWRRDDVVLESTRVGRVGDVDAVADARLVFRQKETAVTFPVSLLRQPLVQAGLARRIDAGDIEAWKASGPAADFPLSVLQLIATLSSSDCPRIGATAEAIGTSVRALQRRLAEVGVSYGRLVARARFATAVHLLQRTDATVLDIALDLGYSDHAHFTRAFRRWTGIAPREFRRVSRKPRTRAPTAADRSIRTATARRGSSLQLAWRG